MSYDRSTTKLFVEANHGSKREAISVTVSPAFSIFLKTSPEIAQLKPTGFSGAIFQVTFGSLFPDRKSGHVKTRYRRDVRDHYRGCDTFASGEARLFQSSPE